MLVLSRKKNESLIIEDDIIVTVVDIRGDRVRLGIEAPTEIPVHRKEVYDAIKREDEIRKKPEYQQFKNYLGSEKFDKAYDMFLDNNDLGNRGEIDLMVYGYQGKLESMK